MVLEAAAGDEEMMDKKNLKRIIAREGLIVLAFVLPSIIEHHSSIRFSSFPVVGQPKRPPYPIKELTYIYIGLTLIRFIIWTVKKSRR